MVVVLNCSNIYPMVVSELVFTIASVMPVMLCEAHIQRIFNMTSRSMESHSANNSLIDIGCQTCLQTHFYKLKVFIFIWFDFINTIQIKSLSLQVYLSFIIHTLYYEINSGISSLCFTYFMHTLGREPYIEWKFGLEMEIITITLPIDYIQCNYIK